MDELRRASTPDQAIGHASRVAPERRPRSTRAHLLAERALERASADLRLLLNTDSETGDRYVAAGVPWFSCAVRPRLDHHRLQLLSVRPQIARNTLTLLARFQATETDDWRDAQPGKILHELRTGELARTNEIPHTPYYGTVDATPLWLMLLGEYERWTGDDELLDQLWPNALAALELDRQVRRPRRRRLRRVRAAVGARPRQPGLEGLVATRSATATARSPTARSRWSRSRATSTRRGAAWPGWRGCAATTSSRERQEQGRRGAAHELRGQLLDGRRRHATRWRSTARSSRSTASPRTPGHALWAGIASPERAASVARVLTSGAHVERLGHPHAVERHRRLQPDRLPPRHDLAARQRHLRGGLRALRTVRGGTQGGRRDCSRRRCTSAKPACPSCSAASTATTRRCPSRTRSPARRRHGPPARCST